MKRVCLGLITATLIMSIILPCSAQNSASDILRAGLLGAGAGAIGGAASGAKGRDVWKGALAGAGINIIGGALLDSITGERVQTESRVRQMPSRDAYSTGYQDGFYNGYKAGYMEGLKDGMKDTLNR